jgi:hypothetical protein
MGNFEPRDDLQAHRGDASLREEIADMEAILKAQRVQAIIVSSFRQSRKNTAAEEGEM